MTHRYPRLRLAGFGRQVSAVALLLCLLHAGLGPAPSARAQAPNMAALVVVHGDGRVVTQCIAFSEPQLNGYDLLRRSGLDLIAEISGMGATVCRLDNEGCAFPQQSCFCQCEGESCTYWSYWQWDGAAWTYSNLGASNQVVLPGSVQGWVWGAGASGLAAAPPAASFASICTPTPAAPTATATVLPTATPGVTPAATATPLPSATATATFVALPTWTPLPATAPNPTPTPLPTATPAPPPPVPAAQAPATAAPMMPTPEIAFFTADRSFIEAGEAVQLSWRVQGAGALHLEAAGVVVPVPGEGTLLLAPQQNTTYLLVATAAGGANRAGLTVAVRPKLAQATLPVAPVASPTIAALASSPTVESPLAPPVPAAPPAPAAVAPEPADAPTSIGVDSVTPVATATSAPVETAPAAPATQAAAGTLVPERSTMVLMVVGLLALVGLPTGLMAGAVVVWLVRRGVR